MKVSEWNKFISLHRQKFFLFQHNQHLVTVPFSKRYIYFIVPPIKNISDSLLIQLCTVVSISVSDKNCGAVNASFNLNNQTFYSVKSGLYRGCATTVNLMLPTVFIVYWLQCGLVLSWNKIGIIFKFYSVNQLLYLIIPCRRNRHFFW